MNWQSTSDGVIIENLRVLTIKQRYRWVLSYLGKLVSLDFFLSGLQLFPDCIAKLNNKTVIKYCNLIKNKNLICVTQTFGSFN